ncbi:sensor histidine kinase [Parapedobacter soli]|uniref:sensor histidine kinase n=1 Tax=Parapedobacter soli TaxID=416955 RepID=UPI0021C9ECFF|nr:HAMP domain-containing sensor histidine kinase [Parapedobacter soli]
MATESPRKSRKDIKQWIGYLIGDQSLPLETRLLNSVCLIAIFIMVFNIPFNYFSGLKTTAAIFTVFTAIVGIAYYQGRRRRRLELGVIIAAGAVIILFSISYFFSAGAKGASLLSFLLSFILTLIMSPKKLYGLWAILFLVIAIGLLVIEYRFPETIQVTYASDKAQFIDLGVAYITGIFICFFGLRYLKKAYNRERASAELKSIELEKMNDEKLKLFSIISHDLQAPLSSLHSYIRLIASDRLTPDERKQVESGLANALHGSQEMLSNMLVWSQSQLSGLRLTLVRNNIAQVLKPVIDIQKIYASQKNIRLESEIDESLHALVDRDILQLIIRNLVTNAIKFTLPSGHIRVLGTRIGEECELIVEDNGIGIAKEQQSELFSLKTRSTYGTNNERGIGLGLFLCHEYTQAFNGTLTFESETGRGTTFRLRLPLVD